MVSPVRDFQASQLSVSYQMVANILRDEFEWAKEVVTEGEPGASLPDLCDTDWETAVKALDIKFTAFKDCIVEAGRQFRRIHEQELAVKPDFQAH